MGEDTTESQGKSTFDSSFNAPIKSETSIHIYSDLERIKGNDINKVNTYKATDENDESVFLKVVEDGDPVKKEVELLQKFDHPNIPKAIEVFDTTIQGEPQTVASYQYIEGDDVKEILQSGRSLSLEAKVKIIKGVGSAVDYANSQGVLHRDIVTENVMVDSQDNAYLTDWSYSSACYDAQEGFTTGRPGHMSPEQLEGKDTPEEGEGYAVALLAYEILTGESLVETMDPTIKSLRGKERTERKHDVNISLTAAFPQAGIDKLRELFPNNENLVSIFNKELRRHSVDRYPSASQFVDMLSVSLGVSND